MGLETEAGTLFAGRFELQEKRSEKGFLERWVARDTRSGETVELRIADPESDVRDIEKHFSSEIKILRKVEADGGHPNVVGFVDGGKHGDVRYLAVEDVGGQRVAEWIRQHGAVTDSSRLRRAGMDLCRALSLIQEYNVVCDSLRPDSIVRDPQGRLRIAEFLWQSIRRANRSDSENSGEEVLPSAFRPPEPREGNVGPWTNVYKIGTVLYALSTGKVSGPPVTGPRDLGDTVEDHLAKTIARATARSPDRRYGNSRMMHLALERRTPLPRVQGRIEHVGEGQEYPIHPGDTIGHEEGHPAIGVQDPNKYVTPVHVGLDVSDGGAWFIRDVSLNGTWVKSEEGDFERLVSRRGQKLLREHGEDPGELPTEASLADGDVFALVHPDQAFRFEFHDAGDELWYCPLCYQSLEGISDPSYCPGCGTELPASDTAGHKRCHRPMAVPADYGLLDGVRPMSVFTYLCPTV